VLAKVTLPGDAADVPNQGAGEDKFMEYASWRATFFAGGSSLQAIKRDPTSRHASPM
jgi:hypothetical protein